MITQPIDSSFRVALRGNVPSQARAEFDQGEVRPELALERMILVLKRSAAQEDELTRLLTEQQSKGSPNYRKWLSPQEFGDRFGPADSDIAAIVSWLQAAGFQVAPLSKGRTTIEFSGTAGLLHNTFGTALHSFIIHGQQYWSNVSDPSIPQALSKVVAGIDSLHSFPKRAQSRILGSYSFPDRRLSSTAPDYTFLLGQFTAYALAPYDFAAIYNLLPLWNATPTPVNGTGQTIAIVGNTDIDPSNATTFWNLFGLDGVHAPQPKLVITYNGPRPGINGNEIEANIDTQWSGAAAPGATINFVASASTLTTDGVDLSALYAVDNNLAPILSESYGLCERDLGTGGTSFFGALWEQAAAQGISVFVAAGDNGAAGCDDPSLPAQNGLQVSGIASTPFNAAVGGTDFNQFRQEATYWNSFNDPVTQQSAKGYIPETTWNDSCTNSLFRLLQGGSTDPETNCNNANFSSFVESIGGSGGSSRVWPKPVWQTGTPQDHARDLPDISLFSSNGFLSSIYVVCQKDASFGICDLNNLAAVGGTSVASPAFAGIMALVNQKNGSPQGIPGTVLYKLASKQPTAFHDVPAGSTISMPCITGSTNCTTKVSGHRYGVLSAVNSGAAYDLATGLGSVNAANLVNNWNTVTFTPSVTAFTLNGGNAVNIQHGAAIPFTINVSPTAATGDAALLVSPGTPDHPAIGEFKLTNAAASGTTSLLPGGSYSVIAHYDGDSNYGGSYSNSVAVKVTAESSKTLPNLEAVDIRGVPVSFAATNATYGTGYFRLRVDVGDSSATVSPGTGISSNCSKRISSCPTGSVTLSASGTTLDGLSASLNSDGYAEFPLSPGTFSISAAYAGDPSYGVSSGSTQFTIAKAPTIASAAVPGSPVEYGNFTQIDAAISTTSNGIAPTGTFQFLVDGSPVGAAAPVYESGPYNPTGSPAYAWADAISSTEFLSVGNHTLAAQYSGDANYAASTSTAAAVTVSRALPFFNSWGWQTFNQPVAIGQTVNTVAQLYGSMSGVAPTGTITFNDNNTPISGTVTYTPSSPPGVLHASVPYTFTTPGSHSLTLSYSGDANYQPATEPTPQVITVLGPVSVTPAGTVSVLSPGQPGSTTLAITPNNNYNGVVTLTCIPDSRAQETTCGFSNGSSSSPSIQVTVNGGPASVTFNVTTTAAHPMGTAKLYFPLQSAPFLLAGAIGCFGARKRNKLLSSCLLVLICLNLLACGGSSSTGGGGGSNTDPGTRPGAYTFTVSATTGSGSSQVVLKTPVTIMVN